MRVNRILSAVRLHIVAGLAFTSLVSSPSCGQGLGDLTHWQEGRSMRAGSNVWIEHDMYDGQNNKDRPDRIEAGHTHVLADLKGPGVITHIWLTFLQEPHTWVV